MKVAIICFTVRGAETAVRIRAALEDREIRKDKADQKDPEIQKDREVREDRKASEDAPASVRVWCAKAGSRPEAQVELWQKSLRQWTQEAFEEYDALVFVGATGIAVRSVAPFLKSKTSDPAVLCVDELGKFVIPLLSGHIGGANELAARLAEGLEAVAVITTATDLNGRFAVDVFAKENQMWISDMKLAKRISAELLDGHEVGFYSDFPWDGDLPEGLTDWTAERGGTAPEEFADRSRGNGGVMPEGLTNWTAEKGGAAPEERLPEYGICVSLDTGKQPFRNTLHLVPQIAVLGLGCRRGKDPAELERFVEMLLEKNRISVHALCMVCSHEVKADESALLEFCATRGLPFRVYTAEELKEAEGIFSSSSFVESQVGVDNVCERSAVLGSGGELRIPKTAENGMTAALALKTWRLSFKQRLSFKIETAI